jgi:hypothetical protein
METGKILLAIEERRKWELREKEILEKLAEIRKEREELIRVISDTKKKIAELDATLTSQKGPSQPTGGAPSSVPGSQTMGPLSR